MSSRILLALIVLSLPRPPGLAGQGLGVFPGVAMRPSAAAAFRPSAASALLLIRRAPAATGIPTIPPGVPALQFDEGGHPFLLEVVALSVASLGGLGLGSLPPFPPADDDSDFSVWHLATAPAASIASVFAASVLLGHDKTASLKASALGSAAGAVTALLASMVLETGGAAVTYAGAHGLVAALLVRSAS